METLLAFKMEQIEKIEFLGMKSEEFYNMAKIVNNEI